MIAHAPRAFAAGKENALALWAVDQLLGHLSGENSAAGIQGPLVFYGPSGTGKSHLVQGIAAQWQRRGAGTAICQTATDFLREYESASSQDRLEAFHARIRRATLLVIEDLDRLGSKWSAQDELVRSLDVVLSHGGRLVISMRRSPSRMPAVLPTLRSRLQAGLAVPLKPPSFATRQWLLDELASLRRLRLSAEARDRLAESITGTARDLHGALVHVEAAQNGSRTLTTAAIEQFLAARSRQRPPTLHAIATQAAKCFGLRCAELRSPSRRRLVVAARGLAIHLARQRCGFAWSRIGEYFGGRDRATVMHAWRTTDGQLQGEPSLKHAYSQMEEMLNLN